MAVFESLSDKMNHIFSKLRNKGKLTELEINRRCARSAWRCSRLTSTSAS